MFNMITSPFAAAARSIVPDGWGAFILCWRCNDQKPRPSSQAHYTDPDLCEPCDEQMAHGDFIFED